MTDHDRLTAFGIAFLKKADAIYDQDFYDWMGHSTGYTYSLVEWLNENIHEIPEDKRTWCTFSLGMSAERHYWERRLCDTRDPEMWLPLGYHGSTHTCMIENQDPADCKTCKKQAEYHEEIHGK